VLAAQVRTARLRRRLTQEVLAERAGLDRSYLSGIERSRHNVPIDTLCRLAWALRMEPRELLSSADGRRRKTAAGQTAAAQLRKG
jgi:transcriptional regulator with XRE-family HTH domain